MTQESHDAGCEGFWKTVLARLELHAQEGPMGKEEARALMEQVPPPAFPGEELGMRIRRMTGARQ